MKTEENFWQQCLLSWQQMLLPLRFLVVIPLMSQGHAFLLQAPAALGVDTQRGGRDQRIMAEDIAEMMQQAKGCGEYVHILSHWYILRLFRRCNGARRWSLLSGFHHSFFGQPDSLRFPDDGIQQHTELLLPG